MSKKPAKTAASENEGSGTPKKRSKLKLALLVLAPLVVLAGGGYAGWTFFLAPAPAEASVQAAEGTEAAGEGASGHAPDPVQVAAVPVDIAAQTSFTHSYALSVLIEEMCGEVSVPALKAASEEEAHADAQLVALSWTAASRRVNALSEKSCGHFFAEIENADAKAATIAAEKAAAAAKGKAKH
jgi:hypothetical protein